MKNLYDYCLFFSSKQALSVSEIAWAVDLDIEKGRESLRYLEHKHLVQCENGIYKISREGLTLIFEKGMQLPKSLEPTKPLKSEADLSLPLFGSWQDLIFWVFFIILSLIFYMGIALLLINRIRNDVVKIAVFVIFLILWFITFFFVQKCIL